MKKTTKILLVLAAVVAMAIGAVSTVMAADEFPQIGEWSYNSSTKKYSATDINGETIVRGWATKDGFWYFFDSSVMVVNTFITYKEDIYYLDNNGHMAIGWIEFAKDQTVNAIDKYDGAVNYTNVTVIDGFDNVFEIDTTDALGGSLFDNLWGRNSINKTVWCYFDEHGVMANDEWVKAWDIWYYMYGAYCVMGDFHVAIDNDGDGAYNDGTDGIYGFGNDGAMLVGWNTYTRNDSSSGTTTDRDTPYENITGVSGATTVYTWYDANGRQVNTKLGSVTATTSFEGWEKIGGKWYYFIDDADENIGIVMIANTVLYDVDTDSTGLLAPDGQKGTFYFDATGAMVTGTQKFTKNKEYAVWNEDNQEWQIFKVVTNYDGTFFFNTTLGKMEDGVIGNYYYKDFTASDEVYLVEASDITTTGSITVDDSTATLTELDGQRIEGKNFIVKTVDTDGTFGSRGNTVYLYFESGKLQKNQGITFGETTLAIDSYGKIRTGADGAEIVVDGFKYKFTNTRTFTIGSEVFYGVVRK